ncbi:MAG: hypothetical protein HY520_02390 [Candidatus Aenigmarchaeota archaeon]|nr:hypothetical protein [Candidatus Aenigmarchaeota archaeon]
MTRHALAFWLVMLLALPALAQGLDISSYAAAYQIQPGGEVAEEVRIAFAAPLNESAANSLRVGEAEGIAVQADQAAIPFRLEEGVLSFSTPAGTRELRISFRAAGLVFRGDGVQQFYVLLTPPEAGLVQVDVVLPRGQVLSGTPFPPGPERETDGERISLAWTFQGSTGPVPVSVQFAPAVDQDLLLLPAGLLAAFVAVGIVLVSYRRQVQRHFLLTFVEDERKVVQRLLREKVVYQNSLERQFGFSRAKATRMLQKLEKRGLVQRERVGRTNRINWTGGHHAADAPGA